MEDGEEEGRKKGKTPSGTRQRLNYLLFSLVFIRCGER